MSKDNLGNKMKKLTRRQKFLVSCTNPYYNGFASKSEVKNAKLLARGSYWYNKDFEEWAAFSPGGKRYYFSLACHVSRSKGIPDFILKIHYNYQKRLAKECAKLWACGKCSEAINLEKSMSGMIT